MQKRKDNITRFPRPLGTTALLMEYHSSGNPEILKQVHDYLINQWLLGNGMLCGVSYDVDTFANNMGIDRNYIRLFMRDRLLNSNLWDIGKSEELLHSLMGEQLAWALEDRMEIAQQVNILRESQGGKYTPFISSELNKTLKLKLESSTSLQTIVRNLTGGNTTNIFTQYNQQNNVQVDNVISLDDARKIILDSQKVISKTEEAKLLEQRYDIGMLPEVVATKQEGIDTSKEGLNLNTQEIKQVTNDYKTAMALSSQEHHDIRREIEMNIDPDEIDPELDLYEEIPEEENTGSFAAGFLR